MELRIIQNTEHRIQETEGFEYGMQKVEIAAARFAGLAMTYESVKLVSQVFILFCVLPFSYGQSAPLMPPIVRFASGISSLAGRISVARRKFTLPSTNRKFLAPSQHHHPPSLSMGT